VGRTTRCDGVFDIEEEGTTLIVFPGAVRLPFSTKVWVCDYDPRTPKEAEQYEEIMCLACDGVGGNANWAVCPDCQGTGHVYRKLCPTESSKEAEQYEEIPAIYCPNCGDAGSRITVGCNAEDCPCPAKLYRKLCPTESSTVPADVNGGDLGTVEGPANEIAHESTQGQNADDREAVADKDPATLTDSEIDCAVAEAMGWEVFELGYFGTEEETPRMRELSEWLDKMEIDYVGTYAIDVSKDFAMPIDTMMAEGFHPSTDLNAAFHAQAVVIEKVGWKTYKAAFVKVLDTLSPEKTDATSFEEFLATANPRIRSEAMLRAVRSEK
jgi:hypothetical protein